MSGQNRPEIPQPEPAADDELEPSRSSPELRQTALAVVITVGVAAVLLAAGTATAGALHTTLILAAPGVVFVGAMYTAIRAYRSSRSGGRWQVWQGGMWFLLMLFLLWGPSAGTFVILGNY